MRSKSGKTGKLQTVYQWSKDMIVLVKKVRVGLRNNR